MMGSKPKNYPTGVTIIQPVLTPEENEANFLKAQNVLALLVIHILKSNGGLPK